MTNSTVKNLNDIAAAGGVENGDLVYIVRPGTPDADYKAGVETVLSYVEATATAFAPTVHTHTASQITDAGLLATKDQIDLSGADATGILAAARFPALAGDVTTGAGTLVTTLANSGVSAGSYTSANITVDAKGRVTAASNGSGGGGTPGGAAGQVQYNASGGFAGAANTTIDAAGNIIFGEYAATSPSAPSAGVTVYARRRAGQALPAWLNAHNRACENLFVPNGKFAVYSANGLGNTLCNGIGPNLTITVTGTATQKAFDGTTFGGSISNLLYVTATSAGSSAGLSTNIGDGAAAFFGTVAGTGGFDLRYRFGVDTATSPMRLFAGLVGQTTNIGNVDPSSISNIVGFGADSGDANMQFIYNGAGTAIKIDMGANFPANTSGVYYETRLYAIPNGSEVYYSIERLENPQFSEGSVSTNLPAATTRLYPQCCINNATAATAAKLSFSRVMMFTDF